LCRVDGKIQGTRYRLTLASDSMSALLNNAKFLAQADVKNINRAAIGMASGLNERGSTYHGEFSAGDYTIELWSYPQFYDVPMGYDLANEGTSQPYIPLGKGLLMPENIDLRLRYAALPVLTDEVDSRLKGWGMLQGLEFAEGEFQYYAHFDDRTKQAEFGVESAPLFIPTQIDGFVTFKDLV